MAVKHTFVSAIADGADATVVRPSNWNDDHTIDAGTITWDTIGAAAADGTSDNGDNLMVYRVAKTTNTENSWRFTESTAATNGTSTSGVPNQVLMRVDTIAASTMSPMAWYSRATFVAAISPTTQQIFATRGTETVPAYSFAAETGTGMSYVSNYLTFSRATVSHLAMGLGFVFIVPTGSATAPPLTNWDHGSTGLQWPANNVMRVVNATDGEWVRFLTRAVQFSRGSADAVGFALNSLKARGTVALPTVITTGDDLLTLSGSGYVGATGLYVEACRITYDSTGTIADTTSGVGGIMRFSTSVVGTVGVAECFTAQAGTIVPTGYTVATLPAVAVAGAIAHVTDQLTAVNAKGIAPTGGGAVVCAQIYNGAAWVGI